MSDSTMRHKPRLRFTSGGWFKLWVIKTGTVHFGTGVVIPDEYGCTERHVSIGPYPTACEAMAA